MKFVIALILAGSMLLCSNADAKKVTPPAPNLAASVSLKSTIDADITPPGDPVVNVSTNISASHSFTITSEQEAALQADAVVDVFGKTFTLGNDPDFQNGDKSASFKTTLPIGFVPIEIPCTVSFKWNKGKMSVSVKGKLKEKGMTLEAATARIQSVNERDIYPMFIETEIIYPSISTLTVIAPLACDVEMSETRGATAEGTEYIKINQTIKSKGFAELIY